MLESIHLVGAPSGWAPIRGSMLPFLALLLSLATELIDALAWLVRVPGEIFHGYSSLLRWAADSVHSLFEQYGYWAIFLGTLTENTLFVGLIVPGALVVILAGISAADGEISLPLAIALGVAGTLIGDTLSYCMGRYGWGRFGQARIFRDVNEKVREPILRRGALFVLFYHFAGYTRVVGPTAAGFLKMPFKRWAPADYGGALLWICSYSAIGVVLGKLGITLSSSDRWFNVIEYALLVVVVVWGLYMYRVALRTWLARRDEPPAAQPEPAEPVAVE